MEPTREQLIENRTLNDVITTQLENTNFASSKVIHLGISDHSLMYMYICRKIGAQKEKPKNC